MRSHRSILLALALAVGATGAASSVASAQTPTPTACPASFHVLHDDHIGTLQLPAGVYRLSTDGITCGEASALFTEFLKDYNGVLPKPWVYNALAPGQGVFTRGQGGPIFATVRSGDRSTATPGPATEGGGSHGDLTCPGSFRVLHNDRIGRLTLPRGNYEVTLLGTTLTCRTADRLFARFLRDRDGNLGGGWAVLHLSGEFVNGSSHTGFRVKLLD